MSFPATSQIVIGDCNVVFENVQITGGTIETSQIEGCRQDPKKTLRIGYFWLDAVSFSFLMSGHNYGAIRELVGARPIIVKNDVFTAAEDLVNKFGSRIDKSSFYAERFKVEVNRDNPYQDNYTYFDKLDPSLLSGVRIYDGNDPIYMPDLESARHISTDLEWPNKYKKYLTSPRMGDDDKLPVYTGASPITADELYGRLILWRHVNRSELQNYQNLLLQTRSEIIKSGSSLPHLPYVAHMYVDPSDYELEQPSESNEEYEENLTQHQIQKIPNLAKNKALSSMLYITREGWPEDFLQAIGYFDGHGEIGSWTVLAPPRKMFILIALIENMGGAGATYTLKGFNIQHSGETKLRSAPENMKPDFVQFTITAVGQGDKIILPLQIEFRKNSNVGVGEAIDDLSARLNSKEEIETSIASLPDTTILQTTDGSIQKTKVAFLGMETPRISRSYIYGPSASLESLVIDDLVLPARQYNPNGLYMVSGYEGGSCPVLYVRRGGQAEPIKIGKILHTANGAGRSTTQIIPLGSGIESVFIAESEPERAVIKGAALISIDPSGQKTSSNLLENPIILEWGDQVKFDIGSARNSDHFLEVEGYYERYEDVAANAAREASGIDR